MQPRGLGCRGSHDDENWWELFNQMSVEFDPHMYICDLSIISIRVPDSATWSSFERCFSHIRRDEEVYDDRDQ
jgi:hypothetical protein